MLTTMVLHRGSLTRVPSKAGKRLDHYYGFTENVLLSLGCFTLTNRLLLP